MDLATLKDRLKGEVEARAEQLDRGVAPDPRAPRDELRGALRPRPPDRADRGRRASPSNVGAYGLDTAFVARAGTDGPTVAVLCEYDALPGIGHACGHNIIATAGLGAGLAAAALAEEAGGRVVLLGTPAEEGGGGKILMARQGAFEGIDAAMMVHPAGDDLARMDVIAVQELTATYTGVAAHAAAFPHRGPQRARRRRARLPERGRAPAAHPARRAHPRRVPGGGGEAEHRPGPGRHRVDGALAQHLEPGPARRHGWRRASRPGATAAGCEVSIDVEAGRVRRHARQRGPWSSSYVANAAALGRTVHRAPGRRGGGRQHRHGQRQLPGAVDPPDDRRGAVGPADPHARSSPSTPGRRGATRPSSTAPSRWPGRSPTSGSTTARPRRRAGRVRRHDGPGGGGGPEVRDRGGRRGLTYGSRRPKDRR